MLLYFTFNTIVETLCLLVALFCLWKDTGSVYPSMILFLFITVVAEMMGVHFKKLYLADRIHNHSNAWIYNILLIFQAGFTYVFFHSLLSRYHKKYTALILSTLVLLAILYTYEVSIDGVFKYHNLTNTVMSIILILLGLFYYYHLLKDDEYIKLKHSSSFWWVAGTLFFYFGTMACDVFYTKLSTITVTPKHYLTYYIYNALNLILYGCWSYSFICRRWLTTTSKSLS